jgi:hypothetical protein
MTTIPASTHMHCFSNGWKTPGPPNRTTRTPWHWPPSTNPACRMCGWCC